MVEKEEYTTKTLLFFFSSLHATFNVLNIWCDLIECRLIYMNFDFMHFISQCVGFMMCVRPFFWCEQRKKINLKIVACDVRYLFDSLN